MRFIVISILACLLTSCAAHRVPSGLDDKTQHAFLQIMNADVWINGNKYGYAGELDNNCATALRTLWKHPKSKELFIRLIDQARPPGQLYALCGLYYSSRQEFDRRVKPFKTDQREIQTISADVQGNQKIADIVVFPYEGTNQLDIISGSWPRIFKSRTD